jgi:NAD(P)-dependent dehydrogenase (short-subunit alcohol dehydrogenase family)
MSNTRTALITGANQGLGFALAEGLAARWTPTDRVLLTGRNPQRVADAVAKIAAGGAVVEGRILDVTDPAAIDALAAELAADGGVNVVVSNATARSTPEDVPADVIDENVETSNLATTRILRAFGPALNAGGRLITVASSLGTLGHLEEQVRPRVAAAAEGTLDEVDALTAQWQAAVHAGTAADDGWSAWLNVPSKVLQVAAVRALARERRDQDLVDGTLVASVCPGLLDTAASRPWFEDMSDAQSPAQGAAAILDLVEAPLDPSQYGELVRFGEVLPWDGATAPRGVHAPAEHR